MSEKNTQAEAPSESAYIPPDQAELQRRELEGLRERLFAALHADKFLAEALREVDHAYDISRGLCSKLLDVAAANYEDAKKWRAALSADDLDAWECTDCGGEGRVTVYHDVSHQLGTDSLPFWETCTTCDGLKFCGPDAEKRAALTTPPAPQQPEALAQQERERAARICEVMRPTGGRAWSTDQRACFEALTEAAAAIRAARSSEGGQP